MKSRHVYTHISRKHGGMKNYCMVLKVDQTNAVKEEEYCGSTISGENTKNDTYKCGECSRDFQNRTNIVEHLRGCNQERRYICPYCPYRSAVRNYIIKHIRVAHPANELFSLDCNIGVKPKG